MRCDVVLDHVALLTESLEEGLCTGLVDRIIPELCGTQRVIVSGVAQHRLRVDGFPRVVVMSQRLRRADKAARSMCHVLLESVVAERLRDKTAIRRGWVLLWQR